MRKSYSKWKTESERVRKREGETELKGARPCEREHKGEQKRQKREGFPK